MELAVAFGVAVGINLLMFIPAFYFRTDKLTDISYAVTFAVVSWFLLVWSGISWPSIVVVGMISLWAVRLGSYLLIRIHKMGRDDRFDKMRSDVKKFGKFWLLQGITVWVVLLPSSIFLINNNAAVPGWAWFGVVIGLTGLIIETIADWQLFRFITDQKNNGMWITNGLWRYSRHPNYFGEITHWVGIYLFVVAGLNGFEKLVGLIGPVYIAGLIIFVSGIPILEKKADKRWGHIKEYQQYKRRTSTLLLLPPKPERL